MTDCLIIGFNDYDFATYAEKVKLGGERSGAFRDLHRNFLYLDESPMRSMDMLNHFNRRDRPTPFSNTDFLWPVVLYLGTYLHRRGFSFDYINQFHLEKEQLKDKLLNDDIRTIAITTTLYVAADPIVEIVSFIRQYNQSAKIVIGGPYVDNQVKRMDEKSLGPILSYLGADFYVASGEGEATLVNLLQALRDNTSLDSVSNIVYRNGKQFTKTACAAESNPLEENMVDYSLFPKADIGQFISTRTSKSCPFACSFCGFPQRAGKYTYTNLDVIEHELNTLNDLGVTTVTFLDDTFNVPLKRFEEILKMIINNKYDFKWNSFYRSDFGTPDTIQLMGEANCEGVFLGMESGSDKMLKLMNKTSRQKDYRKAIPLLQDAGISVHASLIVGFPGETEETVSETVSLIKDTKPDFYRAMLWFADPTTPIWKQKEELGIEGRAFTWSHLTMDSDIASDLVDKILMDIQTSVWLPQEGFEQWSTFYLQRHGIQMPQLKNFLRAFRDAVIEQVMEPERRTVSAELLSEIERHAQFEHLQHVATAAP